MEYAARRSARTVLRQLGPAGPLAVIAATLPAIGGFALLFLLNLVGPWLKAHGAAGMLLYASGFAAAAGLAVLPTYAQSVLGGWAFGFGWGFPAALLGILGGAVLGYVIARRASGERVVRLIAEQPKWAAVHRSLVGGGFWKTLLVVTLVRLPPNSPFAMTNLVLASVGVGPAPYVLGSVVGLAPRTGAAVFLAAGLKELTFGQLEQRWMWIAGIVLTIVVVLILGYIANQSLTKVTTGGQGRPVSAEAGGLRSDHS
ncbi:MAG: VTT domain-containing protein [Planctomycetota bacterium]